MNSPQTNSLFFLTLLSNSPALIQRTLQFAISSNVRTQETTRVISWVALNPAGTVAAWNFIKANWALIINQYGEGGFYLSSLIETVVGRLTTDALLQDATSFFNENPVPTASIAVATALQLIDANVNWIQRSSPLITFWLNANSAV